MSELLSWLQHGSLLLDGALGTELERRGIETSGPSWTSHAIIEHPALIIQIHREYIEAGAKIITANTFRTNPRAHRVGKHSAEDLTKRAIALAREAILSSTARDVLIAGSIAPSMDSIPPQDVESDDKQLLAEHAQMAQWIQEAGADLILIETMNTIREAFIALVAVKRTATLPVIVSLVPDSSGRLISGAALTESLELLAKAGADVLMLNCQSLSIISRMLTEFGSACTGLGLKWGVCPNASETVGEIWQLVAHEDHEFAAFARSALDQGASIIGSCCGTTPATTEAMATVLDAMQ